MQRWIPLTTLAIVAVIGRLTPMAAADTVSFEGTWTLNRALSHIPKEVGFTLVPLPAGAAGGQGASGRGRGNSQGDRDGAFAARESYDDSQRRQVLTNEVREPSPQLMMTERPGMLTIADDQGRARALSLTALRQSIEVLSVPVVVTTSNIQDRYLVVYEVSADRKVRYIYSRSDNPPQLMVDIDFIERNRVGDKAHLVYDRRTAAPPVSGAPTGSAAAGSAGPAAPAAAGRPAEAFDQRPGAELRGLKSLGVVVEALSATARACGLDERAIEAAVSKRLTDGGLTVRRNSDNDTYLYVNIKTERLPDGSCLSRYDSTIYSHTTAKMSYGDTAALVQVELMHRGGLSATSGQHAPAMIRQLEGDIDFFATEIRTANR